MRIVAVDVQLMDNVLSMLIYFLDAQMWWLACIIQCWHGVMVTDLELLVTIQIFYTKVRILLDSFYWLDPLVVAVLVVYSYKHVQK